MNAHNDDDLTHESVTKMSIKLEPAPPSTNVMSL